MIRRIANHLRFSAQLLILRTRRRTTDYLKWRRIGRRVPADVTARVRQHKRDTSDLRATYEHEPAFGVVVTSFNQLWNVHTLADHLLANPHVTEIVVSEDGSLDGSLEAWVSRLTGPNHFVVRSNDLHEIRSLDRAIRLSRSDIVCIIQDDDVIPDQDWAAQALDLFSRHPGLAVLGGFMAYTDAPSFDPVSKDPSLMFVGTTTMDTGDFRFVPTVSIGPYYIRASYYRDSHGFDIAFSEPGQAGVGFDEEFGLRAWLDGWQVGYVQQPFKTGVAGEYDYGSGGTFLYGEAGERTTHDTENKLKIASVYAPHHDSIMSAVRSSNRVLRGNLTNQG